LSQDKGLDNRKNVKTCRFVCPGETPVLSSRRSRGIPDRGPEALADTFPPRCCPPLWKGSVE
jgi:hypothetical protein